MNIQKDDWLGRLLGFNAFKVVVPEDDAMIPALLAELSSVAAFSGQFIFFVKIPVLRVNAARVFSEAGFYIVDTGVTFERAPPEARPVDVFNSVDIRLAAPKDESAVLEIAETAFVYSRFHLDPQIPRAIADAVKRSWVESFFRGRRGDEMMVAVCKGVPVGFLLSLHVTNCGRRVRVIDLIGVAKSHQGRGIGHRLTDFFMARSSGACDELRVGTQVANAPAMNLYFKSGFRIAGAVYILHAHGREGQINR